VYLMGIAQSQKELNAVVAIAKRVRGVKQVISYVRLKYSRLRH
ncbi:MAG: BON domain-containing protein, partial [Anaplasma sp.]|nr:BON domain-containing protein [Anaplasma sp.]